MRALQAVAGCSSALETTVANLPPSQQGPFAGVIRNINRYKLLLRVKEDFFIFLWRQLMGVSYQEAWVRVYPTRRPKHVRRESQNLATLTIRLSARNDISLGYPEFKALGGTLLTAGVEF